MDMNAGGFSEAIRFNQFQFYQPTAESAVFFGLGASVG